MSTSLQDNRVLWNKVLNVCKKKTSNLKNAYDSYFKKTFLSSIEDNTFIIGVENTTTCTIIKNSFYSVFEEAVFEVTETNFRIHFVPLSELTKNKNNTSYLYNLPNYFSQTNYLQKRFTFDSFVEGSSNTNAKKASMLICSQLGSSFYNPLYIQGRSGLGKTHLLHAIGNQIKETNIEKKILYVSSQDFINEYVNFTKNTLQTPSLEEYIKSFDILLIDDIQQLRDKQKTLDFFFNIYNYFIANKKQIVITSDCLQNELNGIPDRLITRFLSGLTVSITYPDFSTCKQIFLKKCEFNSINVENIDDDVINYIVEHNSNSIRALEGVVLQILFRLTSDPDLRITMKELAEILNISDLSIDTKKKTDGNKIVNVVSTYYSIPTDILKGTSRKSNITFARQVCIYLLRTQLDMTFDQIGKIFSNRDHSTIIHSINKIEELLKTDNNTQNVINSLLKKI